MSLSEITEFDWVYHDIDAQVMQARVIRPLIVCALHMRPIQGSGYIPD